MVTGLPIKQKTDTDITILDLNARNSLSVMIRSYEEGRRKFNLNCHFYNHDLFDVTILLKKRADVLTTLVALKAKFWYFENVNKNPV